MGSLILEKGGSMKRYWIACIVVVLFLGGCVVEGVDTSVKVDKVDTSNIAIPALPAPAAPVQ